MVLKASKQKGITFGYCDNKTGQRVFPEPSTSDMPDILPEQEPPAREAPYNADDVDVYDGVHLNITCTPPLAQPTTISRDQHTVRFLVCVETSSAKVVHEQEPEVVIWHNHNGQHDWGELVLRPASADSNHYLIDRTGDETQLWYEGFLTGSPKHAHAVSFTLKARAGPHRQWTWCKDATGLADGVLLYQTHDFDKHSEHDFAHFFAGIDTQLQIKAVRAETPRTLLYALTAPAAAADGKDSGITRLHLGTPKHIVKWFAEVRLWTPWLAPRHGDGQFKIDKDSILLSFLRSDGMHVTALAISGVQDMLTVFSSNSKGEVIIKARNDRPSEGPVRILVAVAESFELANAAVFYHARHVVNGNASVAPERDLSAKEDRSHAEWMEEWYDGFTYCTWNSLGQDLTANKIHDALDDLAKENINITNLIIDDNWQSLTGEQGVDNQMHRGWLDFEANKRGFPDGLAKTTARIRQKHPNIKHIAVWHALFGYWGGVAPEGAIAKRYKTVQVPKNQGTFTVVAAEDAQRMYDDFYRFLAANGVDSVKTDAQFFVDEISNAPDRKALIQEYQDAWTLAHLRHLNARAISCMSQTPQIMFHSQLPTNKPRLLVRNSDDFFPDIDASHPWHVFCNAHNSVISQHLNVLPDWDMFQTSHKWASFHAAARCVSGGPIYFTDYPGHHNIKLIHQMTAQTTRNATIILRPDTVGKTINPYNEYNSQTILKIGTFVGHAQKGTGILGVFNVSQRTLREFVQLSDIPGTATGQYLVRSFNSGQVVVATQQESDHGLLGVKLRPTGWDILAAHALQTFSLSGAKVQVAPLGLLGKMTGSAAVTESDAYIETNGRLRIWLSFKALGVAGVYISTLPEKSLKDNLMVCMYGEPIPAHCVRVNAVTDKVLEIDVERAWKEMKETPGFSNEVSIEVFLH